MSVLSVLKVIIKEDACTGSICYLQFMFSCMGCVSVRSLVMPTAAGTTTEAVLYCEVFIFYVQ